jgi:hypothetical protein
MSEIRPMMGERRVMLEALFYGFSLERHVPDNHLLRRIDRGCVARDEWVKSASIAMRVSGVGQAPIIVLALLTTQLDRSAISRMRKSECPITSTRRQPGKIPELTSATSTSSGDDPDSRSWR